MILRCCSGQEAAEVGQKRLQCEVADIFREHGEEYRQKHSLPLLHLKVMHSIEICRTAQLGGHIEKCNHCGHERTSYNSCRNRHCPKCQNLPRARWLQARKKELLPVSYFHTVFTLPHELNSLALHNKKIIFNILFRSVAETLQKFAAGKGGRIGFIAILHTWDQTLMDHFHLHCLIIGGMLSLDSSRWIPFRKNYLFPVKALSKMFRGKFIYYLKQAFTSNKLIFSGKIAHLASSNEFEQFVLKLWKKDWIVYSKNSFADSSHVLDYLSRYTHRVAISNDRIISLHDGMVSFQYKDRRHNNKLKVMTLNADEFIRRFLIHAVPDSFVRIRHFGFLANRSKKNALSRCRQFLHLPLISIPVAEIKTSELLFELTGIDLNQCPLCKKGTMHIIAQLPPAFGTKCKALYPQPHIWNSS
jgi:Putative transposase/Transposase zinc-binding domain